MAYSTGILDKRITILTRAAAEDGKFGRNSAGVKYTEGSTIWANVTFNKGVKAMREGALDAYNVLLVRCRYTDELTRESRIKYEGKTYQIDSFNADRHANTIQITMTELTNA